MNARMKKFVENTIALILLAVLDVSAKPVFINLKLAEFMPLFRTELSFNRIFETVKTLCLEAKN